MIRLFVVSLSLGLLASCVQYQEPQANCFAFRSGAAAPNCTFMPLGAPEAADAF